MASEAVENYLKALEALCRESPTGEAGMKRLAAVVGVTTGTATSMAKKLAAAKLARYERFGGISLTAKGRAAARDILRRHRLIETFLVETLKLDWSVVHAEAERLEHAISPAVLEALDRHLGYPIVDPHGDPIPDGTGGVREARGRSLCEFSAGARVVVARVADQDREFLEFVARKGLKPGAIATVIAVDVPAQSIRVTPEGGNPVALGFAAAGKIMVENPR
ncbi:MAG: metal-dependent transcriptional regulator [Phycisphaeraceae bacterium]|nr:metal-dependent transcriptional regulator [Phycisphaeraceae bacterium]